MDLKICGVCEEADLRYCSDIGVPYVGLNIIPRSPRYLPLDEAIQLWRTATSVSAISCTPVLIGEGIDAPTAKEIARKWATHMNMTPILQVHKSMSRNVRQEFGQFFTEVWVAVPVHSADDLDVARTYTGDLVLCDGPAPGSGQVFDWSLMTKRVMPPRWGLAGGINPANIREAIGMNPHLIDISSGVEKELRKKDHAKIKMIWDNIRNRRTP